VSHSPESSSAALSVRAVSASYGPLQILFDTTLEVGQGEMVALLGPNGVGKSTLLRVIGGLMPATSGTVMIGGVDVTTASARDRVDLGLCQVVGQATFPSLTVHENLAMHGYAAADRGWHKEAVNAALAVFPRLGSRRDQLASTLSGGERQMLALAKAIVQDPRVLVVDEFSLGLAPVVVGGLIELVRKLNERGAAVLLVEQSVNVALSLVDRAYLMEKGAIIAEERAEDLRNDPERMRALMLGGHGGEGDAAHAHAGGEALS
jgi:branched-chain amino acid transport system ATP-binding protein